VRWGLDVSYRLWYRMAFGYGMRRAVLGVFTRVLLDVYTRNARARGIAGGRTGTVTVLQRAGGALNLHVHFHTLVLDGVFTEARPPARWHFIRRRRPATRRSRRRWR